MRVEGDDGAMTETAKKPLVRVSVRNLVEFILRYGDIDMGAGTGRADTDAMLLGAKIHRRIQRQMGKDYQAEVSLTYQEETASYILLVEGRADGIIQGDPVTVDEIKGVYWNLDAIQEPELLHLAQARCYAYLYAREHERERMDVQITYCQMETEEIRRFTASYSWEEQEKWFRELVDRYHKWALYQVRWRKKRNQSIGALSFPFSFRTGQKKLMAAVYQTIGEQKKLFIQAPTGVGKTLATLYPALKTMGEGQAEKLFYLTARTITRTVAEQAIKLLKEQSLSVKAITLTARDKICFQEERECNPEQCPYAKGHYDRINDAIYDLLTGEEDPDRKTIEICARKWEVCPFELALDTSFWTDVVICDYNYVFDPTAHLQRYFGRKSKPEYLFLIDEAHNLVERGRQMYSASLYKEEFLEAKKKVKKEAPRLARQLEACNRQFLELKRECETCQVQENIGHIGIRLLSLLGELERFFEEHRGQPEQTKEVRELYFHVRHFLKMYEELDEHYVIYTEQRPSGQFLLKLFCVNPAQKLKTYLEYGRSTIFFSATLLPIGYYQRLLGAEEDDYAVYAESVFDERQRKILVGTDVTTKYTSRGKQMYQAYASYILEAVRCHPGNYMVYFPSYAFLAQVEEALQEQLHEKEQAENKEQTENKEQAENRGLTIISQTASMREDAREIFLQAFEEERDDSLLGLCVLGGIFSEGIDLDREKLIGAVIVGTGLPQVCHERELLKQYFDRQGMDGFRYAYLYPGVNKVQQAAGRVLRTEQDKGVILLLDERFLKREYQETFPREWKDWERCDQEKMKALLMRFWEKIV